MATLKAIRKRNDRDPYLKEGVQQLVSTTSVSIYELENLYTKTSPDSPDSGPEHFAPLAIASVAKNKEHGTSASRLRLKPACRRRRGSTRTPSSGLLAVHRRPCGSPAVSPSGRRPRPGSMK